MAQTINEMSRNRRAAIRRLKADLRNVDSAMEKSERRLQRIIDRSNKMPEIADLELLTDELVMVSKMLDGYEESLSNALKEFVLV